MLAFVLLTSLTGQVPAAQGPGPVRYHFQSTAATTVDMSAAGGGSQDINIASEAMLSVSFSDTTGGQLAHIVIDSVTYDGGAMMAQAAAMLPPEATASGKGATWHVYVVGGAVKHAESSAPTNLQAATVAAALPLLFPGLHSGVQTGDHWTDTTTSDTTLSIGAHGKVTTITAWSVAVQSGDSTVVDGAITGTMNMETGMTGQLAMANAGTRHVVALASGIARQATMTVNTTGSMTMGTTIIPIRATVTSTLTQLP